MGRDSRIDTFRGLALVTMTGAHLPLAVSGCFRGNLGFASFTQVFFFLSGIVAGLVYTRRVQQKRDGELRARIGGRVFKLWLTHLLTFAFLLAAVHGLRAAGSPFTLRNGDLFLERPGAAFLLGSVFLYLPAYTGILPLYCIFALLVPPAVAAMLRGRTALVLCISAAVWLTAQFGIENRAVDALGDAMSIRLAPIRVTVWQLFFVGGLAFGVAWARGRLAGVRIGPVAALALLGAFAVLLAVRHGALPDSAISKLISVGGSSIPQGPVCVVNFAVLVGLAAYVSRAAPRLVTWRWLSLLGRHSLAVFAFHLGPVCALALVGNVGVPVQLALAAGALASLTLPAWIAQRQGSRGTSLALDGAR